MSKNIRDQIIQILMRRNMPTRQVAISELVELVVAQVQAPSFPMGITAWIEHGEEYGYYTYVTLQTQILADRRFEAACLTLLEAKWDKGGYICRSCGWSPAWSEVQQDVVEALDEKKISLPCPSENDDRSKHRGICLDNPIAIARKIYYASGGEEGKDNE